MTDNLASPLITDHPYEGAPDGKYCNYDYGDIDLIDFCNMPRSEHAQDGGTP